MVQRMADNDKIVTRYMDDKEFGAAAFTGAVLTPGAFWQLIVGALPRELVPLGLLMIVLLW